MGIAGPDVGYFPRGESVLRRVHEQRLVGLHYGQRALCIGAINPLNFIGTRLHTRAPERPFQRLAPTGKMFETIFFGTRAEADRVLAHVRRLHLGVRGQLPDDAGKYSAGTPYSALDPALMFWTVAVIADSATTFYELFCHRLPIEEKERLWQDYLLFGELFGMPREAAPATWSEFREYWQAEIEGPAAYLTDEARHTGSAILLQIPVPLTHRPAMRVHNLLMRGTLPRRVRELYGFEWNSRHEAAFKVVVAGMRRSRPLAPRRARIGRNTAFFDLVADSERSLIRRGRTVPGSLSAYRSRAAA